MGTRNDSVPDTKDNKTIEVRNSVSYSNEEFGGESPISDRRRTTSVNHNNYPEDWEKDEDVSHCKTCNKPFSLLNRKHHCRNCGGIFCADCTKQRSVIKEKSYHEPVRVCGRCYFSLTKDPYAKMSPNLQLKTQVSALEEVSQALTRENAQLRSLVENLQKIVSEQNIAIERLWKQDQLNQKENEELKMKIKKCETYHGKMVPLFGRGKPIGTISLSPTKDSTTTTTTTSDFDPSRSSRLLQTENLPRESQRFSKDASPK